MRSNAYVKNYNRENGFGSIGDGTGELPPNTSAGITIFLEFIG